jgi:curved DNA-binding protein CbpA
MNPYDVLGVEASATAHQIKTAYRLKAKQTHPDAPGGGGDAFAEVSKAYGILIDPVTRKRFDETGSIDDVPPVSVRQRMIVILAGMFNEALNVEAKRGTSFDHFDLMTAMRAQIRQNLDAVRQNQAAFRRRIADRKILLKRIVRKDDGQNLFADVIRQQLSELEPAQRQADIDVLAMEMATDELSHYKSEVELMQAVQMMQFGGNFTSNSSGANYVFFGGGTRG